MTDALPEESLCPRGSQLPQTELMAFTGSQAVWWLSLSNLPVDPDGQHSESNATCHSQTCKTAKCNKRKIYKLKLEVTKNFITSRNDATTCKRSKEGLGQTAVRQQTRKCQRSCQWVPVRNGSQCRTERKFKIYGIVKDISQSLRGRIPT